MKLKPENLIELGLVLFLVGCLMFGIWFEHGSQIELAIYNLTHPPLEGSNH